LKAFGPLQNGRKDRRKARKNALSSVKKLLVGSVYIPDDRNEFWLRLQLHYLKRFVGDFDHVVFSNRAVTSVFRESTVIGSIPAELGFQWGEYGRAMDSLMTYFAASDNYEYYLVLDPDAFPFKPQWVDELAELMRARPEFEIVDRRFAAPVRCENLDTFPHGCAFFAERDWLKTNVGRLGWADVPTTNLLGVACKDATLVDQTIAFDPNGKQIWLPLLRTNSVNFHPIIGAVYGDIFYHHGAGSRPPRFRAVSHGAYDNFADQSVTDRRGAEMFDALQRDPSAYLKTLTSEQKITKRRFWS
jgi:hypothetical protein